MPVPESVATEWMLVRDLAESHAGLIMRVGSIEGLFVRMVIEPHGMMEFDGSAVYVPGPLLLELEGAGGVAGITLVPVKAGESVALLGESSS